MPITEEDKQRSSKVRASIELIFGKINGDIKECDLIGMSRSMVRITDNARALKEQNLINSNQYLDIINRIDDRIIDASRKCRCKTLKG